MINQGSFLLLLLLLLSNFCGCHVSTANCSKARPAATAAAVFHIAVITAGGEHTIARMQAGAVAAA
jgi:hypothetical protein